jgi:hypothetical protein
VEIFRALPLAGNDCQVANRFVHRRSRARQTVFRGTETIALSSSGSVTQFSGMPYISHYSFSVLDFHYGLVSGNMHRRSDCKCGFRDRSFNPENNTLGIPPFHRVDHRYVYSAQYSQSSNHGLNFTFSS